ncbi:MAG: molybdopterin-binding protein [Candidatus Humimicrobiaceae bacterium]
MLLLSGGVSVGEYDYVKEILVDAGAELIFWRVNQKPGKPLTFLTSGDKMIFGLPGNPVSIIDCFEMYARPLIRKMMGYKDLFRKKVRAKALEDIRRKREGLTLPGLSSLNRETPIILSLPEPRDQGY